MHDVAVVGGGVVGCALLRRLALHGLDAVLLERGRDILSGASKANSALLHTGFDAPKGSLELACMREGYREYLDIRDSLGLPLVQTGAVMVAWNDSERARLPDLIAKAHANGVTDVRPLTTPELHALEPGLAPGALAGLHVPGEHVIDPWSAPLAYVRQAMAHGATVMRNCEVLDGVREGNTWRLVTPQGDVGARVVINAAGLYGDLVERFARTPPFEIRPRKGQFVVLDKSAREAVSTIVLPVPTERTKGVIVCPTAFGNVIVGPTAEEQTARDHAATDTAALEALVRRGREILPALAGHAVTATYAGLRPATERPEYRIEALPDERWISVAGIRSTGLTAALGIARHVLDLYRRHFGPVADEAVPISTPVTNLCESLPRPWMQPGAGEIVCHCERVTRTEIEAALSGPLPAGDLGGLRRRTRVMLGRCQGFHCAGRVAQLAAGRLPEFSAGRP
jgi:glycerol-3-phosphate dehydrogenase